MASRLKKYAFINAKLRARISKILSDDFFNQMVRVSSLNETVQLLKNTNYNTITDVYDRCGDLKMCELELKKKEIELFLELKKYVDSGIFNFIKTVLSQFEIDILKFALRLWFDRVIRKRNIDKIANYIIFYKINYDIKIEEIINSNSIEEIIVLLINTPYEEILIKTNDLIVKKKSLFFFEVALDRYYFKELLGSTAFLTKRDIGIAEKIIGVNIDIQNINRIVRFKNLKLPVELIPDLVISHGKNLTPELLSDLYSKEDSLSFLFSIIKKKYINIPDLMTSQSGNMFSKLLLIENILEQMILKEIKNIKTGDPFTIGIILTYFFLKQNEIRKIITVLNAKYYNIDEERIMGIL